MNKTRYITISGISLSLIIECSSVILIALLLNLIWSSRPEVANHFSYLADSLLHGHVWVSGPTGDDADPALWNGLRYVIEGPFPSLLVMPMLPWFGLTPFSQVYTSNIVGAIAVGLVWRLGLSYGLNKSARLWICAMAFAGTDLWWASARGSVWFFNYAVEFTLMIGMLIELQGKKRGWLLGILLICTMLTRQSSVLGLIWLAFLLPRRSMIIYLSSAILGGLLLIAYNEARWGTITDMGYNLYCVKDSFCTHGLFNISYLPYELYSFLLMMPEYKPEYGFPFMNMSVFGTAITFTSPALIAAFYTKRDKWMWLIALILALPDLFYYLAGEAQVGMRHALDFEAFLIAAMMLAIKDNSRWWFKPLIVWSCLVGYWSLICWNRYH